MELDKLKDLFFDFLNENDEMLIADIETREKENIFAVRMASGRIYEIEFREVQSQPK